MKGSKKMTATEFLCTIRSQCKKGCDNCALNSGQDSKKLCVFHYFDLISDKSISFISSKINELTYRI